MQVNKNPNYLTCTPDIKKSHYWQKLDILFFVPSHSIDLGGEGGLGGEGKKNTYQQNTTGWEIKCWWSINWIFYYHQSLETRLSLLSSSQAAFQQDTQTSVHQNLYSWNNNIFLSDHYLEIKYIKGVHSYHSKGTREVFWKEGTGLHTPRSPVKMHGLSCCTENCYCALKTIITF